MARVRGLPLPVQWYSDCDEKTEGAQNDGFGYFIGNEGTLLDFVVINNAVRGVVFDGDDFVTVEIGILSMRLEDDDDVW